MLFSCILSIGKEIVSGYIQDSNSAYIASYLTEIGINNRYIVSVDDEENDIKESIEHYLDKVDLLITTGGLGPTFDDITLPSLAKSIKKKLIFSQNSYNHIKQFYENLYKLGKIDSYEMNEKRVKMAYIPETSIELENTEGAASGIYIKHNSKHIFCLPGIPKEMKPMFENQVLPIVRQLSNSVIVTRTYEFEINDETILGTFIDKIKNQNLHIKSLPTGFDSKTMGVRFTAYGKTNEECISAIEDAKNRLSRDLSHNV